MTKIGSYTLGDEATFRSTDPLAGVDWCWVKTTNRVATNLPVVFALRAGEQPSTRISRGVQFAFSNYETLLKRLAD